MQVLSGLGSLRVVILPVASRFMLGIRASAPTALGVGVVLLGEGCWLRCGRKVVGRGCGSACRTVHAMRSPTFCCGPSGVTLATEQLRCQWALAPWTARPSPTLPPTTATGNALIILYGPAEVTFTLGQLRHQWATPAMTTFLVVLGGLLCVLQWMHWRLGRAARAAAGLQPSLAAAMEGGGGKPSVELDAGGGRTLLPAGSGKWVGSVGGGTPIPLAPSGGSMGPLGLFPLLGPRDHDTVTVFAGALLFSAVASFVGAWSVLFSKSLTYVVSYMPGSLTDWCGVLVGWGGVAGKGASGSWQANTRWRDAEPGAEPSTPARPPESALCNNPLARWSPHRPRRPTSFACFYLVELLLLGSPNPTQPNPTQPRYSWFVLAAFLGTAAFWVRQSDRGLRHYPASLIMPLMQVGGGAVPACSTCFPQVGEGGRATVMERLAAGAHPCLCCRAALPPRRLVLSPCACLTSPQPSPTGLLDVHERAGGGDLL